MIKQLMSELGYGFFAEAAVVMFALIFVAIVIHTCLQSRDDSQMWASLPLESEPQHD